MNNEELENNQNVEQNEENIQNEEISIIEEETTPQNQAPTEKKKHSPCLIATGVLAALSFIGVVIIFIMTFCCNGSSCGASKTSSPKAVVQTGDLKIAFVNTDSILVHYEYAKDLEKGLKAFQTSLESNYQAAGQKLQADYENYLKTGDKLTLTEQKKKEEDLTRRQQEFPMLQQKMMAQLQERQLEDNKKLLDAVYAFIKDYNSKNQKYNIILSRSYISSAVLYADEGYDLTNEIIEGLNKEYKNIKGK